MLIPALLFYSFVAGLIFGGVATIAATEDVIKDNKWLFWGANALVSVVWPISAPIAIYWIFKRA